MKIILVGGGKVGTALARQLSEEDHNVTIVDTNKARVEHLTESYDVLGIVGNGSSITTLAEAGIEDADVFIAVTGSDELNLLCCMFAKKAGHCHAIARVRNPSYSHELDFIKKQIGISAIINPEMAAAKEISHLLRFPGASKIDTFADGRVRLIKFALTAEQGLDGVAIREIPTRLKSDILVCAVERSGGVIIPNGDFVLQNGDQVTFLATQDKAHEFFQRIHLPVRPVRNAFIVGGGAIAFYLSQELLENHVRVRIVERDPARCMELVYVLDKALKLLHPFMPFITEELYQALPGSAETIMTQSWPTFDEAHNWAEEEEAFEKVMDYIKAVRTMRTEMNVHPAKKTSMIIETADPAPFRNAEVYLAKFAFATDVTFTEKYEGSTDGMVQVSTHTARGFIPMMELIDREKELARLNKEKAKAEKELAMFENQLANPKFVERAPAALVEEIRAKRTNSQSKLANIEQSIKALG